MTFQGVPEGARSHVPQTDGGSPISAGQSPAVGTEGHTGDPIPMPFQGVSEGARDCVPQEDRTGTPTAFTGPDIRTKTGQDPAVGTKRQAGNPIRMTFERVLNFVGSGVIQPNTHAAPNRQAGAVRRIPHGRSRTPTQTDLGLGRQRLKWGFPSHNGRCRGQEQAQTCSHHPDWDLHGQHRTASSMANQPHTLHQGQEHPAVMIRTFSVSPTSRTRERKRWIASKPALA